MKKYDLIIVGLGPAGCTAGIYATRYALKTLIVGSIPGGQANEAYQIDNYPGLLNISGIELMKKLMDHVKTLGADIVFNEVVEIKKKENTFVVKTYSESYESKSVILATGSKKRNLNIPGEEEFRGRGVSYCATCDAAFFKNKIVCVIGGGNAAIMSAMMLAEHAKKVYIAYRKEKKDMRAMPSWIEKAEKNEKIEMIFSAIPKRIEGKEKVEAIVFDKNSEEFKLTVDGVFIEIGSEPQNSLAKQLGIELTKEGKIKVDEEMKTNIEGVFAAGDVTNASANFEQIIVACAEGAIAARSAYQYLKK
ncbi:MAG: FAD-dependent oxidoreductase [Candidatus Aenigmatarchaeota archaeon]